MNLSRILTCSALLVSLFAFTQKDKPLYKNISAHWAQIPMGILVKSVDLTGTKPLKDSLSIPSFWMSKTEITNFEYLEFVSAIKKSGNSELLAKVLPDTNVWILKNAYNKPYVTYYFRHPAYRNYPVVGITHEAALLYCQWLTDIYNTRLKELFPKLMAKKVDVRLPSIDEWMWAAKGGHELSLYPWGSPYLRSSRKGFEGDFQCNFRSVGDGAISYDASTTLPVLKNIPYEEYLNDFQNITAPVRTYWPNDYGLYNMAGNVAEMTSKPGTAKGGSWFTCGHDVQIEAPDPFEGDLSPKASVGFRPVFVIVE